MPEDSPQEFQIAPFTEVVDSEGMAEGVKGTPHTRDAEFAARSLEITKDVSLQKLRASLRGKDVVKIVFGEIPI